METRREKEVRSSTSSVSPSWWRDEHTSGWDRVKEALRRDWEQTKADLSKTKGTDLNQNVGDTVKQAAGKQPVPPPYQQTRPDEKWEEIEPAVRYGYGSRTQYAAQHSDWDDRLEGKLRQEWTDLKTGRTWDEVKGSVRRGWDHNRKS